MPTGRAVYRENRFRDGVTYVLEVNAVDGGLYGAFTCRVCGMTEVNAILSATQAEAIGQTLVSLDAHHMDRHAS
jgi:hypothetical protein